MSHPKKEYDNVVFAQRTGTLTLAAPGVLFKASSTAENDPKPFVYRFKWNAIQKYTLNKATAPKSMIKISILTAAADPQEQHLMFQMQDRAASESLRDEIEIRQASSSSQTRSSTATNTSASQTARSSTASGSTAVVAARASSTTSHKSMSKAGAQEKEEESKDEEEIQATPVKTAFSASAPPMSTGILVPVLQEQAVVGTNNKTTPGNMVSVIDPSAGKGLNINGSMYGTSKYLAPSQGARLMAEAELEDFAPAGCICYKPCVSDKERKRTYVRVFDSRVEANIPYNPFCGCGKERCIVDKPMILFFDKAPNRAGMYCGFVPCICCGPPVIFTKIPKACCALVDLRPCYGETILWAPCDCFNLRVCCGCCGPQCYQACALPIFCVPFRNGDNFLAHWKGALEAYQDKNEIPKDQRAVFLKVEHRFCNQDSGRPIEAIRMDR